jgi:hypothetical protein
MTSRRDAGADPFGRHLLCERCDWHYVVGDGAAMHRCPRCTSADLIPIDAADDRSLRHAPELVVPFSVTSATLAAQIRRFAEGIPFPPPDLNPETLQTRLQPLYLPMWLVDCDVAAQWQAEVGFDYEVLSHQERYADGAGWRTDEVRETRVRWEPRAGTLHRHYENTVAPAQELHAAIQRALGDFRLEEAVPFTPEMLTGAAIRVPDRAPDTAWADAEVVLRERAIEECSQAAEADHLRDFRWAPTYAGHHWTLLLLPVLTTTYNDDDGEPQRVLINGQTGRLYGAKRGSSARATQRATIIGAVALALFIVSLAAALFSLLLPPLLVVGVIGALTAVLVGAAAVVPVARVWAFNRRQRLHGSEV